MYMDFKQTIAEIAASGDDADAKAEAAHALIKKLSGESLTSSELTRLQVQMNGKLKVTKGDFYSLLREYRRDAKEQEDLQAKQATEAKLKQDKISWDLILQLYKQTTSTTIDLMEIVLATLISVRITLVHKLPLIWLILAGLPSGDKTTKAVSPSKAPQVHVIDKITGAGLASGFVDPKTGKKAEKDFIQKLHREALVIKDMASCFNQNPNTVRGLIGDLTNMYDGQFKKITGTVGEVGGESLFSLIACTTPASLKDHHIYMAKLGPRFFTYLLPECSEEQRASGLDIAWRGMQGKAKEQFDLAVSAYFYQLYALPDDEIHKIKIPDTFKDEITVMADLLCCIRSYASKKVVKDEETDKKDSYFEIQREEPFRAFLQIRCYLLSFALVNGRRQVTEHDMDMMRKVVLHSGPLDRTAILGLFAASGPEALSIPNCAKLIKRSYNRTKEMMDELAEVGILEKRGSQVGAVYHPVERFRLVISGRSGGRTTRESIS